MASKADIPFEYGALAEFCTPEALPRLCAILDAVGDGLVVTDVNGRFVVVNPAAERILRRPLIDLNPHEWSAHFGMYLPDGKTLYPAADLPWSRAMRGEAIDSAEIFVQHEEAPDGVWISTTARPLLDEQGRIEGGVAVFRDITERKRAEEERTRLLEREQAARAEAEGTLQARRTLEQRMRLLVDASAYLLGALSIESVLPAITELARNMVAADAYAVWRAEGGAWRIAMSEGLSEAYRNEVVEIEGDGQLGSEPVIFDDVETSPRIAHRSGIYRREGIRAILAVPLRIRGVNSGTIAFYRRTTERFNASDVQAATALANLGGAALGTAELYSLESRFRAEAQENERRSTFLADATHLIASSLDYETTLAEVGRLAVPLVADLFAVHLCDDDGGIQALTLANAEPSKRESARRITSLYTPDSEAPHWVPYVVRTGRAEIMPSIPDEVLVETARDAEHLRLLRDAGLTSYICVPITARGRILGAISLVSAESQRHYGPADVALAEHLGRRAGLAIDNARLYREAQRAREAAETSLNASRRSEARFRRLLDSGIIGIVLGEGEKILEANDVFVRMTGYKREEFAAGEVTWRQLTPPEYAHLDEKAAEQLLREGASAAFEKECIRKDGGRVPIYVGAALVEAPPRTSWVSFVLDLTERKRLEQRLRDSQKLESIGLLAGGIAHDFNNLLTGIMGNASLALDDVREGNPMRNWLENVVRASERAAHLTRQLLAYSGQGRFVIQKVNLSELVAEISALIDMSIPKKVELRLDLDPDLPAVEADASQLQQLVMNLVLNGAEAIGDEIGTVLVRTRLEQIDENYIRTGVLGDDIGSGPYISLEVHDTGCGMDEATRARIFDPFFTTKFTGRGLGLAAALGIVRSHKGDIRVYSLPGHGSTFKVILPAASGVSEQAQGVRPIESLQGAGTILVADDEEVIRLTARAALERFGYRVITARNGREAVDAYLRAAGSIAVVLLDLTMPVMSGEETYAQLVRIREDVKVIVSSGYNEIEAARRFTGSHVAAFIQKPYSARQLAEKIKAVLEDRAPGLGALLNSAA